ncbi:MAG: hypothetical protein LBT60_05140, partial [Oscillospiraceae bacterium]|nr:hypothetical protein [Oscillospiraceae bacterium]
MDEIAADFTEKLLTSPEAIRQLIADNRTVAQKFYDALRDFMVKLRTALGGTTVNQSAPSVDTGGLDSAALERAEQLWVEAFRAATTAIDTTRGIGNGQGIPLGAQASDNEGTETTTERPRRNRRGPGEVGDRLPMNEAPAARVPTVPTEKKQAETAQMPEWLAKPQVILPDWMAQEGGNTGSQAASSEEERYSIGYTEDNTPFVTVDRDILAGVPENKWAKTVKDNLKQKFPNGVTVGNNQIRIDRQTRKEMTYSKYAQWLDENDRTVYQDKLRVTNNADEILRASRNYVNEKPMHHRKDDIASFARGTVLLRVGANDYIATVIVGT